MVFEMVDGIVGHLFVPPLMAGGVKQTHLVNNVVSKTDKLGSQQVIASFCCNFLPNMNLLEYIIDRGGRGPRPGHVLLVLVQIGLGDLDIGVAQISEHLQAGYLPKY